MKAARSTPMSAIGDKLQEEFNRIFGNDNPWKPQGANQPKSDEEAYDDLLSDLHLAKSDVLAEINSFFSRADTNNVEWYDTSVYREFTKLVKPTRYRAFTIETAYRMQKAIPFHDTGNTFWADMHATQIPIAIGVLQRLFQAAMDADSALMTIERHVREAIINPQNTRASLALRHAVRHGELVRHKRPDLVLPNGPIDNIASLAWGTRETGPFVSDVNNAIAARQTLAPPFGTLLLSEDRARAQERWDEAQRFDSTQKNITPRAKNPAHIEGFVPHWTDNPDTMYKTTTRKRRKTSKKKGKPKKHTKRAKTPNRKSVAATMHLLKTGLLPNGRPASSCVLNMMRKAWKL